MDDHRVGDIAHDLRLALDALQRVEQALARTSAAAVTADQVDDLARRLDQLGRELEAVRRLDVGSRLAQVEERMEERIALLQYLGDEWAKLINPQLKSSRLADLNRAVDSVTRTVRFGLLLVVVVQIALIVLVIVVG